MNLQKAPRRRTTEIAAKKKGLRVLGKFADLRGPICR
jgi:hypothetical protein